MANKYAFLYDRKKIAELSDGVRKSWEIGEIVGCPEKYVQKVWLQNPHLKRPPRHAPRGECNPSWTGGRIYERSGYVLIPCPELGHPGARRSGQHRYGRILEHRFVMEKTIGRRLQDSEVVDHIDGCRMHNDPKNLRLFASNAEHLNQTIGGLTPRWTEEGKAVNTRAGRQQKDRTQINTYKTRLRQGDVRLQQILLGHVLLGKDSIYLLGSQRYLLEKQIDPNDDQKIRNALRELYRQWGYDRELYQLENLP